MRHEQTASAARHDGVPASKPAASSRPPTTVRHGAGNCVEPPTRILVVDDDPDGRDFLTATLERRDYLVDAVGTGQEALMSLAESPFDLVLLDVQLPDCSGLDVLAKIRERFDPLELPVIMTTGRTASEHVVEALRLDANDYVTKPLDLPVMLARIETHRSMRRRAIEKRQELPSQVPGLIAPGHTIADKYLLIREIGSGGFAVVFEATQLSTGQRVAIKILRSASDPAQIARFGVEVQATACLKHPHIVRLVDSGKVLGSMPSHDQQHPISQREPALGPAYGAEIPFLVMEFLEGETLSKRLRRSGKLEWMEAVDLVLPIASALVCVHDRGILHRDVKPANILLARNHDETIMPIVLDFGVAKPLYASSDITGTSAVIGTPHYLSPEQARGERMLDHRSDQYALATVLYECLTGRRPFDGSDNVLGLVHLITHGDFPKPRTVVPEIPADLERTLLVAMAREPDGRYDTMRAFGRALLAYASPSVAERLAKSFEEQTAPPSIEVESVLPSGVAPTIEAADVRDLVATKRVNRS